MSGSYICFGWSQACQDIVQCIIHQEPPFRGASAVIAASLNGCTVLAISSNEILQYLLVKF